MDKKDDLFEKEQELPGQQEAENAVINPFENNQRVEDDIKQSKDKLNNEQRFKEAQTERD